MPTPFLKNPEISLLDSISSILTKEGYRTKIKKGGTPELLIEGDEGSTSIFVDEIEEDGNGAWIEFEQGRGSKVHIGLPISSYGLELLLADTFEFIGEGIKPKRSHLSLVKSEIVAAFKELNINVVNGKINKKDLILVVSYLKDLVKD